MEGSTLISRQTRTSLPHIEGISDQKANSINLIFYYNSMSVRDRPNSGIILGQRPVNGGTRRRGDIMDIGPEDSGRGAALAMTSSRPTNVSTALYRLL